MENQANAPETEQTHLIVETQRSTKQFKQYLFEGLMIFLAVSLGFLADNLRETIAESSQARQLAMSLYNEAYKDSVELTKVLANRNQKVAELKFFIDFVRDSSLINPSERFLKSYTWSFIAVTSIHFDPSDGVLQQIHNSNNLQLFKSAELQNQINDLLVNTNRLRNRWNHELDFQQSRIVPFSLKYQDFRWYRKITHDYELAFLDALKSTENNFVKRPMRNSNTFDKGEAESLAHMYLLYLNGTKNNYLDKYMVTITQLLKTLRNEYPTETKMQIKLI